MADHLPKVSLDVRNADTLLDMANDYARICKILQTDMTVDQHAARDELKYECASARKAALRQIRRT